MSEIGAKNWEFRVDWLASLIGFRDGLVVVQKIDDHFGPIGRVHFGRPTLSTLSLNILNALSETIFKLFSELVQSILLVY